MLCNKSAIKKMTFSDNSTQNAHEPVRRLSLNDWRAELLPCAPYQAAYQATHSSIGFAFAHQSGIHAIGTDKRVDFQATPNSIAFVPRGCDVFSESELGGEYLRIWQTSEPATITQKVRSVRNVIDPDAVRAAHGLRRLLISGKTLDKLLCEQYLLTLQTCGIQAKYNACDDEYANTHQSDTKWRSQIVDYIEASLNTQLSLSELASHSHLSIRQFNRKFTKLIGVTPHSYIVERRLIRVRQLLTNSSWDMSSIAYDCGFSSHSHMSAQLRARYGVTPSQLRTLIT